MFPKKQTLPTSKPDPPILVSILLSILISTCMLGFTSIIFNLKSINDTLRQDETNQGYTIPEIPIAPHRR